MLLGFNTVGVCSLFSGVDLRLEENKSSHAREQTLPRSFLFNKKRACCLLTLNGTKTNLSCVAREHRSVHGLPKHWRCKSTVSGLGRGDTLLPYWGSREGHNPDFVCTFNWFWHWLPATPCSDPVWWAQSAPPEWPGCTDSVLLCCSRINSVSITHLFLWECQQGCIITLCHFKYMYH